MATPPTLIAMAEDNYITNNITITFVSSPLWIAAITRINIDSNIASSDDYTTADTSIIFDRDLFNRVNSFTILIEATGYDDISITQSVEVCLYDNITPYSYVDIIAQEPNLLNYITADTDRVKIIKEFVAFDLEQKLSISQTQGEFLYDSTFKILDHIENPLQLRNAFVYRAIVQICSSESVQERDKYSQNFELYTMKYKRQLEKALRNITFNVSFVGSKHKEIRFTR